MVYNININKTDTYNMSHCNFDNLPIEMINSIFKDGRVFSHFMEVWIAQNYGLDHVKGCKDHDLVDKNDPSIKYEVKTFTKRGCNFCPSNMLGQGRTFDNTVFVEKTKKLIFCITSNIHFPEVKIKFIHGTDLINNYPNGKIPLGDLIKFFN
tara:strand:- start:3464 stop:3919 length:456 start_codon:yes stop_codon:yes gene_type:complete